MPRRTILHGVITVPMVTAGCLEPEVEERPTGELDIAFASNADRDYLIRVELIDADGRIEDVFESGFPPDQDGAPSYYSAGLSNGPYTIKIGTETAQASIEWSITECPRLDLDVTIRADGTIDAVRRCAEQ